jgi:cyclophilin family peptidyl-prolyl cis-trans isomerase
MEMVADNDITPLLSELSASLTLAVDPSFRNKVFPEGERCLNGELLSLTQRTTDLIFPGGFAVPAASDEHWNFKFHAANSSNQTRRDRLKLRLYFIRDHSLVYPITPLHWQTANSKPSSKAVLSNFFADFEFLRPEWKSDPSKSAPFCGVPSVDTCTDTKTVSTAGSNTGTKQSHDSDQYPLFDASKDGPLLGEIKQVELQTTAGSITLTIDPQLAPCSATQIYRLLMKGAYDGTPIFRYEPNFVIQAANAEEKAAGAERLSDQTRALLRRLPLEIQAQKQGLVLHRPYVLSLGRWDDDPNSAVSSFSMIIGDAPHLDLKYTIFGRIARDTTSAATLERIKQQWPKKPTILKARNFHGQNSP